MTENKFSLKRILFFAAAVIVTATLAILPVISSSRDNQDGIKQVTVSAKAELKNIDTLLLGGGQLESSGIFSIEIPSEIKIKEFLVKNGQNISKGEAVAVIDPVSVMTAITKTEDSIKAIDAQINKADTKAASANICCTPGGTVKAVYAKPGDDVSSVMERYGALAVISLDNLMAVKLNSQADFAAGDTVNVYIGTENAAGMVRSNIGGELIVTVEDKNYEIGKTAVIFDQNGKELGSGALYVYSAWNTVAYSGTVTAVKAILNNKAFAGQVLFTVAETGKSAAFFQALDKRQKYEKFEAELFELYSAGVLYAPCDGIISGIDLNGSFMLTSGKEVYSFEIFPGTTAYAETQTVEIIDKTLPRGRTGSEYSHTLKTEPQAEGIWTAENLPAGLVLNEKTGLISGVPTEKCSDRIVTISFTGESTTAWAEIPITITDSETNIYKAYLAVVIDGSSKGGSVNVLRIEEPYIVSADDGMPAVDTGELEFKVNEIYTGNAIGRAGLVTGDMFWAVFTQNDSEDNVNMPQLAVKYGTNLINTGGNTVGTGGIGGFSGRGGASAARKEDDLYTLDKIAVAYVTSQEEMKLTVSIDELDITRLFVGQKAKISLNSAADVSVDAIVSCIVNEGKNSGGNTKFDIEFTLGKADNMLPGMKATAEIKLDTIKDALCIPAGAVYEREGKLYVYTGFDEKKNILTDERAVTTGAADSSYVQILSGLDLGTAVYYKTYQAFDSVK